MRQWKRPEIKSQNPVRFIHYTVEPFSLHQEIPTTYNQIWHRQGLGKQKQMYLTLKVISISSRFNPVPFPKRVWNTENGPRSCKTTLIITLLTCFPSLNVQIRSWTIMHTLSELVTTLNWESIKGLENVSVGTSAVINGSVLSLWHVLREVT